MKFFRFFFLSLFLPTLLHSGFFDWLFPEEEHVITQFECPYNCGGVGSESLERLEIQAIRVLWELDRFSHIYRNLPFCDNPPTTFSDPWAQKLVQSCIDLTFGNCHENIKFPHLKDECLTKNDKRRCGCINVEDGTYSACWDIEHCYAEDNETYLGKLFNVRYGFRLSDEKFRCDERDSFYLADPSEIVSFSSAINIWLEEFCSRKWAHYFYTKENLWIARRVESLQYALKYDKEKLEKLNSDITELEKHNKTVPEWILHERAKLINVSLPEDEKRLEEALTAQNSILSEEAARYEVISVHTPLVLAQVDVFKRIYNNILDTCIKQHKAPSAYFHRAQLHFDEGLNMNCLEDIRKLLENTPLKILTEEMLKRLHFKKGSVEGEMALFNEAIFTLSTFLQNHPRHREAYIERAMAYFEAGDFRSAIQDYIYSNEKSLHITSSWEDGLEFAGGLIEGITRGAGESLVEFVPGMLSSVQGLGNGLWAFVTNPGEVSKQFVYACENAIQFMHSQGFSGTIKTLCPEIRELVDGGALLSYQRQGELLGYLIGRHGVDFLLLAGVGKGLHVYRDLRKANALLSLEKMALSAEKGCALEALHQQWWSKTAPIIEQLKATKGGRIGNELYQHFRNHPLSENQVRQILHQAGFKTFPRPKGIPYEWKVNLSEKGGGMRYIYSKNNQFEIRVMPGNPTSFNPAQKTPYVKHRTDKGYLDKYGNLVKKGSFESHIPIDEYDFEKLSKLVNFYD